MNPLAALSAVLALALFPGAAYAGATALVVTWVGRVPRGLGPARLEELAVAAGVVAGAGLLALPGSPLYALPTGTSLAGILTAIAAGVALGTSRAWPWHRVMAAAAALLPLIGLAASARTLDMRTVAVIPAEAARLWAASAALLAIPAVVRPFDPAPSRLSRSALLATASLLVTTIAIYSQLSGLPAAGVAAICALLSVSYAGLVGLLWRPLAFLGPVLGVLAVLPAGFALVMTLG